MALETWWALWKWRPLKMRTLASLVRARASWTALHGLVPDTQAGLAAEKERTMISLLRCL